MARQKMVDTVITVGLTSGLLDFLKSESDLRGLSVTDVIRVAVYEMGERREEMNIVRMERRARAAKEYGEVKMGKPKGGEEES